MSSPKRSKFVPVAGTRANRLRDTNGDNNTLTMGVSLSGNLKLSVFEAAAHASASALAPLLKSFLARGKTLASLGGRNRTTMLHEAAYADNAETCAYLLSRNAPLNARDKAKATPLQMACLAGAARCVPLLLERGAKVSDADAQGTTPLHAASIAGHVGNVRLLIKWKADVRAKDQFGATPLHYAALHGQIGVVVYLLKKDADPNAVDEEGLSAVHMALEDGHLDCVKALLAKGANPNVVSDAGQTPLHLAAERNRLGCADALIDARADLSIIDAAGSTPLHLAAFHGHAVMVRLLLAKGASVDADVPPMPPSAPSPASGHDKRSAAPDDDDEDAALVYDTPLHHAAHQGQLECIKLLLENNADVDARDAAGASALHKACFHGHAACAQALLDAGANVSARDAEGSTSLHRAAHAGSEACVRLLIDRGADARAQDASKGTPLHNAAYAGQHKIVVMLVDAGAVVDAQDDTGNSPLHLAMHQSQRDCAKVLLARGASPKLVNGKGMIPLHYAVNDAKSLRLLLELGCDADTPDERGRTPLFYAVRGGCEDAVRVLVRAGANMDRKDQKGKSPLDVATKQVRRWLQRLMSERDNAAKSEAVRAYRRVVPHFNESPKKGVAWAVENGVLPDGRPETVAEFLHTCDELNKAQIGQYLVGKSEEDLALRNAYMAGCDFSGMHVAEALRDLLTRFRLPGEAQQIDRMTESFAARYHEANPDRFQHKDTAYILSVAIIMLNTDAHNPNIKPENKMNRDEFCHNCRGIDQGKDLPRDYLEELYDDVVSNEIKMDRGGSTEGSAIKGFLTKQGGRIKTWKKRWFVVSDGCLYYYKDETGREPLGIIPLENVDVRLSKKKKFCFELWQSDSQMMKAAKIAADGSIQRGHHDSYALAASSGEELKAWVSAIEQAVCANPFRVMIDRKVARAKAARELESDPSSSDLRASQSQSIGDSSSLEIDFATAYKHVGMLRMATRSETYLKKKFGDDTVVLKTRRLAIYLVVDKIDAKQQYLILTPENATAQRRLHRAWGADQSGDTDGDDDVIFDDVSVSELVNESEGMPARRATDQYNNDGSAGVGALSAEQICKRAEKLLYIQESVDELFQTFSKALDPGLFLTVVSYSVASWVAVLLAERLKNSGKRLRLIETYGALRFAQASELSRFRGLPLRRIRIVDDPVPLCVLPGRRHVGTPIVLLKGSYYSKLTLANDDSEEWLALQATGRPLMSASHHLDEYSSSIRLLHKESKPVLVDYRSPERLKHSI